MTAKPVIRRRQAREDIEQATDHYWREGGPALAARWAEAIESALSHISAHPATGSTRYADTLATPDLRFWPIKRFPYLIFYVERAEQIDVWRVLHGARDIPDWLRTQAPMS